MALAARKPDQCRRRIQRAITGRRGRAGDRLYRARCTLRTGAGLLTDAQAERPENLFADDRHAAVQASWGVYQRLIQAHRVQDPGLGKHLTQRLADSLRQADPHALEETHTGQDPDRNNPRHPWPTSTALVPPTAPRQAINGRLEHLRAIALGLRHLTSHTTRSLIHTGHLKHHPAATT